jgi:hypothetical protein
VAGKTFHAGGSIGAWLRRARRLPESHGSIIVLLTLMVLAVILSTQFSFGRMFASVMRHAQDASGSGLGLAAQLARSRDGRIAHDADCRSPDEEGRHWRETVRGRNGDESSPRASARSR